MPAYYFKKTSPVEPVLLKAVKENSHRVSIHVMVKR